MTITTTTKINRKICILGFVKGFCRMSLAGGCKEPWHGLGGLEFASTIHGTAWGNRARKLVWEWTAIPTCCPFSTAAFWGTDASPSVPLMCETCFKIYYLIKNGICQLAAAPTPSHHCVGAGTIVQSGTQAQEWVSFPGNRGWWQCEKFKKVQGFL